jgi:lipopolysaccharide/colanic/teichoic acid biosynthesis glycosyltransferase
VGRVLRRWSIDELPQILNVLKGEMSFIGPRPIVDAERQFYDQDFRYYCMVRPGLSGLWQVSGRSNVDYGKRVLLDCRYAQEWSLALDVAIFFRTIYVVATAHGAC